MSATATTAAMMNCAHHGMPNSPESRPADAAEREHEERHLEREHLDRGEDEDEHQPDDPRVLGQHIQFVLLRARPASKLAGRMPRRGS